MFARLKQSFRDFKNTPSGTRFQRLYLARASRPPMLRTILSITAGALLILLGIAMLVLPGPGLVAILLGACLIAGESLLVARLFDRLDFRATALYASWRREKPQ
jgi:Putative transmembrane protein (PGPGW)